MGENKTKVKTTLLWTYKVLRSLIFSIIVLAVVLVALVYTSLSIPPVQNWIKGKVEAELETFFGNHIEIDRLKIIPLNEIIIEGADIHDLNEESCLKIERLGAGINLWRLVFGGKIEITYVELINFSANVYQRAEGEPLNIDFIIKALTKKDENKPPARFDLKIRNIVLRQGSARFSRLWKPETAGDKIDFNHLEITDLAADVTIPRLSNDHSVIDVRRLSLNEKSGLSIKEIGGVFKLEPDHLEVQDFVVRLPETELHTSNFTLPLDLASLGDRMVEVKIENSRITPSNLAAFYPPLANFDTPMAFQTEVGANLSDIRISELTLSSANDFQLSLSGAVRNYSDLDAAEIDVNSLAAHISQAQLQQAAGSFMKGASPLADIILSGIGAVNLDMNGMYRFKTGELGASTTLQTALGEIDLTTAGRLTENGFEGDINVGVPQLRLFGIPVGKYLSYIANSLIGFRGKLNFKDFMASSGNLDFQFEELDVLNRRISNLSGRVAKEGALCTVELASDDSDLKCEIDAEALLAGEDSQWRLTADIEDFDTYNSLLTETNTPRYEIKGIIELDAVGNNLDNITGQLSLNDFRITNSEGKSLDVDRLTVSVDETAGYKSIRLASDMVDLSLDGNYVLSKVPVMIHQTLASVFPGLVRDDREKAECGSGELLVSMKDAQPLIDFFKIPVIPLTALNVKGSFDGEDGTVSLSTEIPFIQQGKNLITDTYLDLSLDGLQQRVALQAGTVYPTKKGLLQLDADLTGRDNNYRLELDFNKDRDVAFRGRAALDILAEFGRAEGGMLLGVDWERSTLMLNGAEWVIEDSEMTFDGRALRIKDFCVRHNEQFVLISGYNDVEDNGEITLTLSDINLDYLFDTLNIPHVNFGGQATGGVTASSIFSGDPQVSTDKLTIEDFSYNGAVLGHGDVTARLNLPKKMVAIGADITKGDHTVAKADGGVWFGRDSLAFNFLADRVNVGFMQPFMKAFSSDVRGEASGEALLYGTFSDIDMVGTITAHDVSIKIDYINAYYSGSDTVYLTPGRIDIPHFKVADTYGHTAVVEGLLTHRYFHEPAFRFRINDMDHLMVYNTDSRINPRWYGKIFASGRGEVVGEPGSVTISADVVTDSGSDFTFVLSDQQEAQKSHFLTFTDRRKEEEERNREADEREKILNRFNYNVVNSQEEESDVFTLDLRASVTNDIKLNLIMDPIAGDKITAYGDGAMTMTYSSLTDELLLYGKYTLEKGTYNFSLQDIILKDFIIKPGSSIAFTGDPYTGILDITAAYRVNTSLTELDSSFATDRELNRTSVPVEALLIVTGVLTSPNIDFDIALPTVTEETARKVKSIISTDDMMSRQVLYLVALNKFYPPEYMATTNSGGEWASIASSTISSQIQNALGQLTDKVTIAPSIRSDKGDFSDIEFDLALSSQLFNNRLLINGNVGYRDPSNSNTTFVGDFDLEYLLTKKGNWRLKAYNHFNDQNYYLKSALTTQGLGIVWRKDFGYPASAVQTPKKEPVRSKEEEPAPQPEQPTPEPEQPTPVPEQADIE